MRSTYKTVYLYILLTAALVTVVCARHNNNFYSTNSHNDGSEAQWNAKHSNRNASEMVQSPKMPHRFRHHHSTQHHSSQGNGLTSNYKYEKHSQHQSNDDAGSSRLPGVQRQSTHIHEDDVAGASNNRHIHRFDTLKLQQLQQQHHALQRLHREQQQQQSNDQREEHHSHHHPHHHHQHHNKSHLDEITTQDPFRLPHSQNIRAQSTRKPQSATTKSSASMKWRKGLSPVGADNRSITNNQRKLGIQKQSLHGSGLDLHRKGIPITTTTTTTTSTTTTTLAPESGFNGIDDDEINDTDQSEDDYYENDDFNDGDDEVDDDDDYDEDIEFTMKKGTRSITSESFGRPITSNRLSYENYQKDDPIRSALASTSNQRNRQHPNALEGTSMETKRNSPNIRVSVKLLSKCLGVLWCDFLPVFVGLFFLSWNLYRVFMWPHKTHTCMEKSAFFEYVEFH